MKFQLSFGLAERSVLLPFFCLVFALPANAQPNARQSSVSQSAAVTEAVRSSFASALEPVTAFKPYYLTGDFNGDGPEDLLIVVRIRGQRSDLPKDVRVINPFEAGGRVTFPANPAGENKLGLAIIHGWKNPQTAAKFLLFGEAPVLILQYDRATSGRPDDAKDLMELISRRGKRRRGLTLPRGAKGDAIDLGSQVGDSVLYWNGRTYRWEDSPED